MKHDTGATDGMGVATADEPEIVRDERWIRAQKALEQSELLIDAARVAHAYDQMAEDIARRWRHANPVILCVMIGGLVPTAELIRRLDFPFELDYIHATRYRGATSGGKLEWKLRPDTDLRGRSVLIVDDILDEGLTLQGILNDMRDTGAKEVVSAVLVEKMLARGAPAVKADIIGLQAPDRYLFGCGMDYLGYLRQVPAIHAVPESLL